MFSTCHILCLQQTNQTWTRDIPQLPQHNGTKYGNSGKSLYGKTAGLLVCLSAPSFTPRTSSTPCFAFVLIYLGLMDGGDRATGTLRVRPPDSSKHSTSTLLLPTRTARSEEMTDISSLVQGTLMVRFCIPLPCPTCLTSHLSLPIKIGVLTLFFVNRIHSFCLLLHLRRRVFQDVLEQIRHSYREFTFYPSNQILAQPGAFLYVIPSPVIFFQVKTKADNVLSDPP